MTESEYKDTIKALKKTRKKATVSKEAARAYLVKLGVFTASGKLTQEYDKQAAA